MVIGIDDEAGFLELVDHVQIAAGVLAEAVNQLHDGSGRLNGGIAPGLDGVSAVGGGEGEFSDRHKTTSYILYCTK